MRRAGGRGRGRSSRCRRTGSRSCAASSICSAGTASTAPATSSPASPTCTGRGRISSLEGGVVAIFLERLARSEPTTIFGDGLQIRDFVYVGDVVAALFAAAGHDGGVFNVGSGVGTTVLDLHRGCAEVAGSSAEPAFEDARLGDVRRSILDVSHTERELGWRAADPLADGLQHTWSWTTASLAR